jgi:hypothetical protein
VAGKLAVLKRKAIRRYASVIEKLDCEPRDFRVAVLKIVSICNAYECDCDIIFGQSQSHRSMTSHCHISLFEK